MKKVHFNNLANNRWWPMLLILALFAVLFSLFEPVELKNPKIYDYLSAFGYVIGAAFFIQRAIFRYYVEYNKKGVIIRINSWKGKSFRFEEIESFWLDQNELHIKSHGKGKVVIKLTNIDEKDSDKIISIISTFTNKSMHANSQDE